MRFGVLFVITLLIVMALAFLPYSAVQENRQMSDYSTKASYYYWAKSYGTSGDELSYSAVRGMYNNVMVGGEISEGNYYYMWSLYLNETGEIVWQKKYNFTNSTVTKVTYFPAPGGGKFVFIGNANDGFVALWMAAINGNLVKQTLYNTSTLYLISEDATMNESGYVIVTGMAYPVGSSYSDAFVVKLTPTGDIVWQKCFYNNYSASLENVYFVDNGKCILVGTTNPPTSYNSNYLWILYLDADGSVIWEKVYAPPPPDDDCTDARVVQTSDGRFVVVATYEFFDVVIMKLNSFGNIIWQKLYTGFQRYTQQSIIETSDGDLLMVGTIKNETTGKSDISVIRLDPYGNIKWQKAYGGVNDDDIVGKSCVIETDDGGFLICGATTSFGKGGYDVWCIKIGPNGEIVFDDGSGAYIYDTNITVQDISMSLTSISLPVKDVNISPHTLNYAFEDTYARAETQATPTYVSENIVFYLIIIVLLFAVALRKP